MSESLLNNLVGKRVRLLDMPNDPCPIEAGATGTVRRVIDMPGQSKCTQIDVDWDEDAEGRRRSLMLVTPPDRYEVIG